MKTFLRKDLLKNYKKTIFRKFNKYKLHSSFTDNIWGANLADMELISKFNTKSRFLLDVIDIYSKYVWVTPLNDKKGIAITNALRKILYQSNHKPNKIWVDKDNEYCNR